MAVAFLVALFCMLVLACWCFVLPLGVYFVFRTAVCERPLLEWHVANFGLMVLLVVLLWRARRIGVDLGSLVSVAAFLCLAVLTWCTGLYWSFLVHDCAEGLLLVTRVVASVQLVIALALIFSTLIGAVVVARRVVFK